MRAPWLAAVLLLTAAHPVLADGAAPASAAARLALAFPPVAPLAPGDQVTVSGNLTYTHAASSPNVTQVRLGLGPLPDWLHATLDPTFAVAAANDSVGRDVLAITITLAVLPGAPALAQQGLQVVAEADANPPIEAADGNADVAVQVAYEGRLLVEAPAEARGLLGEPLTVTVRATNEGNGVAKVLLDASSPSRSLQLVAPPPVVVDVGQAREVNVSALASEPGRVPVSLRYGSAYAYDARLAGPGGTVSLVLDVEPPSVLPAPGPGLALLAAGMAALALTRAARRCRR